MQVGDAEIGGGAGQGHRAPLRAALVDRQLASLDDCPERAARADQGQVGASLAGRDQIGVEAGCRGAQRAKAVARGQRQVRLGAAGAGQRSGEARRTLLQQRDVPGGARERRGELGLEVAVDLDVSRVALAHAK